MKRRFVVEGMSCASCVSHVKKAVEKIDGVKNVDINLNLKKMDVEMDDSVNNDKIISAVKSAGYQATLKIDTKDISMKIKGITCANCVKTIEKALLKTEGVESCKVNMLQNTALISYDQDKISINDIKKVIKSAGYQTEDISHHEDDYTDETIERENKAKRVGLMVSIVFTLLLLFISMGEMIGLVLPKFMDPMHHPMVFAIVQLILTLPPIYIGRDFYLKGFKMLWKRTPNMDSLIALGTSASIIYSLYAMVMIANTGNMHHLYFETAATILTLILLGKYLENLSKGKASSAVRDLLNLTPDKAILINDDQEKEILVEEINVGDLLLVKPGSKVPIDGIIIEGSTSIDESMITGESLPVNKDVNQMVIQGSLNNSGLIKIKAKRVGKDTSLAKIIDLVEKAEMSKAPIAKLADRISSIFVPAILFIAILSMVIWLIAGQSLIFSLTIAITVLVIACPCALGLATPTSIIVGTGMAAKHGIIFKDGETIENAHKIDAIVFDKTGTLTENKPIVNEIIPLNMEEDQLLSLIYSAEKNSNHPLAKAIQTYVNTHPVPTLEFTFHKETPGKGIEFTYENNKFYLGSKKYLKQMGIDFKKLHINAPNKSIIYLGSLNKVLGYITISDQVKASAFEMIKKINELGIETHILSGDNYEATAMVANQLKVKSIHANVLPEDKYKEIMKLQKLGKKVAMVGDGINDSIALKQADIGISLSSSTDVAITSCDIILMKNDLLDIVRVLEMSKRIIRNIKQNLFWAFAYNTLGIPFAAGIVFALGGPLLNPMMAAAAMSLSSITVVLNALRIKKYIYK
ncbi:cadmium-translocating P-type ATPase [Hujiaoplasma nucleasis]|uniref:Copper-exporting P-type ATPase n=1 Tax=Hujiaoplasma nucleasis TaxID=2725268 RepID=A0A7L6N0C3_9MOLU|nr:heavy metal translocating P-type ATPase [Hujiaoplasma nucleasis]QLY39683.1 cadmium-translocating P-type ATPase [Hujiaoplasma nucleasis]